jgi:hypothetical protein
MFSPKFSTPQMSRGVKISEPGNFSEAVTCGNMFTNETLSRNDTDS